MADITLDPDDPATWATAEKGKDASGPFHNLQGQVRANMLQVCLYPHQSATSDCFTNIFLYFSLFLQLFPALPRRYSVVFFFLHSFTPPMRQKVKIAVGHSYITAAPDNNSRPTNTTTTATATATAPTSCARRVNFGVRLSFAVCPTGADHEIILIIAVSSCHQGGARRGPRAH
jgi:hypothetical protein